MTKWNKTLAVLASALFLTACSNLSDVTPDGTTANPVWPDISKARVKGGTWEDWDTTHELVAGMTKEQLYNKLGVPHFDEGLVDVREWNYVFNYLRQGEKMTCQLKILFDKDMKAQTFMWNPTSCQERYQLSADFLFDFDSAVLSDKGEQAIGDVARNLKANKAVHIRVNGYADRIGMPEYNLDLSQRRAQAVVDALIKHDINPNYLKAQGFGQAEPLVLCEGQGGEELIKCLAPNRRVEIIAR